MGLEYETWGNLRKDAEAGRIQFDPAYAKRGAQACLDQLHDLRGLRDVFRDDDMLKPPADYMGGLASGESLRLAYHKKTEELVQLLNQHIGTLEQMGLTFIAAGKAYAGNEAGSADLFKDMKSPTDQSHYTKWTPRPDKAPWNPRPGSHTNGLEASPTGGKWTDTETPGIYTYRDGNAYTAPPELAQYQGGTKDTSVNFSVEPPESLSPADLWMLGYKIREGHILDVAKRWYDGHSAIKIWLNDQFRPEMNAVLEFWAGNGAKGAKDAVTAYLEKITPLYETMRLMAENMHYTAEWLRFTYISMPRNMEGLKPGKMTQAELNHFREEYRKHYFNGMANTKGYMPAMPYVHPVQPASNNGGNNNGGNNGGNNNGGNNNGGNNNGGNNGNNNGGGNNGGGNNGNNNGGNGDLPEYDTEKEAYEAGYEKGKSEGNQGSNSDGTGGNGSGSGSGSNSSTGSGSGSEWGGSSGSGGGDPAAQDTSGNTDSQGNTNPEGESEGSGGQSNTPTYDPAEYGSGQGTGGGAGGGEMPGDTSSGQQGSSGTPVTPTVPPAEYPQGTETPRDTGTPKDPATGMPKTPTVADVLSKLTGVPAASLPEAWQNKPIIGSGKDGAPTLADALSQITGVPADQLPEELKDVPLSELFDPKSEFWTEQQQALLGEDATIEEMFGKDSPLSTVLGGDTPISSLLQDPAGTLGSGIQDFLGVLGDALTQGIQAFAELGATPGLDVFGNLLDPGQVQNHLAGLLDPTGTGGGGDFLDLPMHAATAGGGGGGLSPHAPAELPLTPYPDGDRPHSAFPRATLAGPSLETAGFHGSAGSNPMQSSGMPGAPMMGSPMGAAGAGSSHQDEHQTANFLYSRDNLEEVFDTVDGKVKPVIER